MEIERCVICVDRGSTRFDPLCRLNPQSVYTGTHMKRRAYFAAVAALVTSFDASAVGSIAQIAVIDRRTGVELTPYLYHGEYWVAGTPGATYAIEIRNHLSERLLAVTSVDGVNVISGTNAAWDQSGYVFDPGESYQITGWRKSDAEVAAFTFTDSPNSYAARTGRPANIGVIGVALFRERPAQQVYAPPVMSQSAGPPEAGRANPAAPGAPRVPAPTANAPAAEAAPPEPPVLAEAAAAAADSAGAPGSATNSAAAAPAATPSPPPPASPSIAARESKPAPLTRAPAPTPKLGTGHGEHEYSYVSHTEFTRMQPQPNEVIRIRYDSFDNLVATGIIARPHPTVPTPNPFPGSPVQQYVPDPPGGTVGQIQR
jgi:hypothetical protein